MHGIPTRPVGLGIGLSDILLHVNAIKYISRQRANNTDSKHRSNIYLPSMNVDVENKILKSLLTSVAKSFKSYIHLSTV